MRAGALSLTGLLTVLALPTSAQLGVYRLEDCGFYQIGTEFCSPEQASAALEWIEPSWGLQFSENDPFAIVTILGYLKQGIDSRIETGLCEPGEDLAYAVTEIWAMYVGDLPEDAPTSYEMDFLIVDRFVNNAVEYLDNGDCDRP
ncbi:hypothetical protein AADZ90_014000 [Aestuariibius sp. 2305UL40-4]|uniref:hypothetical protein n=1 Tax=Aestuariibius violaceus TaxID=3234132 RepID=UPI00345EDDB8